MPKNFTPFIISSKKKFLIKLILKFCEIFVMPRLLAYPHAFCQTKNESFVAK
jgi:hypothetical protein